MDLHRVPTWKQWVSNNLNSIYSRQFFDQNSESFYYLQPGFGKRAFTKKYASFLFYVAVLYPSVNIPQYC